MKFLTAFSLLAAVTAPLTRALSLDTSDSDSICTAVGLIADGMMDYYEGTRYGGTVGMFQSPYYWWQAGEAWGGLLDMWYYCQNDTYETIIYDALMHQRGDDNDYIPSNQSTTEGNDDQGLWGLVVMAATERNFTNPPDDDPGWLALTQAVFNTMWARWDTEYCGGGLRWQIFTWNSGYTYKNSVSTGCMFNIGARLARYTSNDSYVDKCDEMWEWITGVEFAVLSGDSYSIYDGASIDDNCSSITESEWTYNFGLYLAGCAYLYNYTENSTWQDRATYVLNGISIFLNSTTGIIYERQCQSSGTCNTDERSFKSVFSRMLGLTSILVPSLTSDIDDVIQKSAVGAAESCSGGSDGHTCGINWSYGGWDGWYGLGEQMCALEIIQNLLVHDRDAPYTADTGGSSKGNANAGSDSSSSSSTSSNDLTIKSKDKVGAGILTAVVLATVFGGAVWMIL